MGQHSQMYIHNVAGTVLGQIGGFSFAWPKDTDAKEKVNTDEFGNMVWGRCGTKVMDAVSKMGPAARGRIAACGIGHGSTCSDNFGHWHVNQGKMLNEAYKGDQLLTLLATYVVVAAVVDILRAEVREMETVEDNRRWAQKLVEEQSRDIYGSAAG